MQYLIIHVFCEWGYDVGHGVHYQLVFVRVNSKRRRRHGQFDILRPSLHCRSRAVQTFNVAGQSRNTQRLKGPETGAWLEECVAQHEHTQSSTAKHKTPTCCESAWYLAWVPRLIKKAQCSERNVNKCECNVSFLFNSRQVIHAQVLGEFCEYVRSPVTARPSKSATSTPWLRVSTVLLRAQGLCNAHISWKLFLARADFLQNFSFRTFAMCLSIFWFCLDWQWRAFWQ